MGSAEVFLIISNFNEIISFDPSGLLKVKSQGLSNLICVGLIWVVRSEFSF